MMKFPAQFIAVLLLALAYMQPAFALTEQEQSRALRAISEARTEIQATLRLVPRFLENSVGVGLRNADDRLVDAERTLERTHVARPWSCEINSTFDGAFIGYGDSIKEARQNALAVCQSNSRNDGLFCKEDTLRCIRGR